MREESFIPMRVIPAIRTVLVYMLGSNTLGGFVESNISAMQRAVAKGALNNGNLLLYIDRYNAPATLERSLSRTRQ